MGLTVTGMKREEIEAAAAGAGLRVTEFTDMGDRVLVGFGRHGIGAWKDDTRALRWDVVIRHETELLFLTFGAPLPEALAAIRADIEEIAGVLVRDADWSITEARNRRREADAAERGGQS